MFKFSGINKCFESSRFDLNRCMKCVTVGQIVALQFAHPCQSFVDVSHNMCAPMIGIIIFVYCSFGFGFFFSLCFFEVGFLWIFISIQLFLFVSFVNLIFIWKKKDTLFGSLYYFNIENSAEQWDSALFVEYGRVWIFCCVFFSFSISFSFAVHINV